MCSFLLVTIYSYALFQSLNFNDALVSSACYFGAAKMHSIVVESIRTIQMQVFFQLQIHAEFYWLASQPNA